jgi:phosphatidylinositol alpha-1,6-mannosyltransferase
MRILVVTPTFLPVVGGAEILLLEVFRRLALRHDVLLVTAAKQGDAHGKDALVNFPVVRYRDRWSPMKLKGHRMTAGIVPPFSLSALPAVSNAIADFKPDILNAHYMVHTGLAAAAGAARHGVPVVLTFPGRDIPGPATPWFWKFYCRWAASRADDVTYITDFCRRAIYDGKPPTAGHIIPPGVDLEAYRPNAGGSEIRERLGLAADTPVLFAMQRLSPEKRVEVVIESFAIVSRKHPEARLVVGGTGPSLSDLQALAQKLGLADTVLFTGYIPDDDLPRYYAACDIFVFHSAYETFGIVLAEAMAAGKPIVSVNHTAIPDVVSDRDTGILVPPFDPAAMARAISELIDDPNERARLGANGRMFAESNLSWDRVAAMYEDVFEAVMR